MIFPWYGKGKHKIILFVDDWYDLYNSFDSDNIVADTVYT